MQLASFGAQTRKAEWHIGAGEIRQQSFLRSASSSCQSSGPTPSSIRLNYSHIAIFAHEELPLAPSLLPSPRPLLNVLLGIAYCRKGCILACSVAFVFSSGSPFVSCSFCSLGFLFYFSLLHCRCLHLISTPKLLTILSQLDLKQAWICCWGSLNS